VVYFLQKVKGMDCYVLSSLSLLKQFHATNEVWLPMWYEEYFLPRVRQMG